MTVKTIQNNKLKKKNNQNIKTQILSSIKKYTHISQRMKNKENKKVIRKLKRNFLVISIERDCLLDKMI